MKPVENARCGGELVLREHVVMVIAQLHVPAPSADAELVRAVTDEPTVKPVTFTLRAA
jgi:hypothetical protein